MCDGNKHLLALPDFHVYDLKNQSFLIKIFTVTVSSYFYQGEYLACKYSLGTVKRVPRSWDRIDDVITFQYEAIMGAEGSYEDGDDHILGASVKSVYDYAITLKHATMRSRSLPVNRIFNRKCIIYLFFQQKVAVCRNLIYPTRTFQTLLLWNLTPLFDQQFQNPLFHDPLLVCIFCTGTKDHCFNIFPLF